jgi:hypothetical protein
LSVEQALREQGYLSPQQAALMATLYKARRTVTALALMELLPRADHAAELESNWSKVIVHRVRFFLGKDVIETIHGVGYKITPYGVEVVQRALAGERVAIRPRIHHPQATWRGKNANRSTRKLTDDQVRAVRSSSETLRALAEQFPLSLAALYRVRNHETYRDVA